MVKTTPHFQTKTWLLPSTFGALAARLIKLSIAQFEHGEHSLGMFIRPHRWRYIQPFVLVSGKSTTVPWLSCVSCVWCNLNRAHVKWISCKQTYLQYVRRNHLSQVMWQECFHCSNEWFIGTFKLRVLWKQNIKTSQKNTVQFKISCIKCYATCLKVFFFFMNSRSVFPSLPLPSSHRALTGSVMLGSYGGFPNESFLTTQAGNRTYK